MYGLHEAAKDGDLLAIDRLVHLGVGVDRIDGARRTPLSYASEKGHWEAIDRLVQHGASVDTIDYFRKTPLSYASKNGHCEAIDRLVQHGASVDMIDGFSRTPLSYASENGHCEAIDRLVHHGASVDMIDGFSRTPLSYASENGHCEAIDRLVHHGASVDMIDDLSKTPLSYASEKGNCEAIDRLVHHGASVNMMIDRHGRTPLSYASENGHFEAIDRLVHHGASVDMIDDFSKTPLSYASEKGNCEAIDRLVHHGASVNMIDVFSRTPLSYASERGHCEAINCLVGENNGNVNKQDMTGSTPIHLAAKRGHIDIIKKLFGKDGDVNITNSAGLKPFHLASLHGHKKSLEFLLEQCGTSINISNKDEVSLMHKILIESPQYILKSLVGDSLSINARGQFKRTFLHLVACLGCSELFEYLLTLDEIEVDCVDDLGRTPLHYATEIGDINMVKNLREKGCDPAKLDNRKMSVLHLAAIHGHAKLIEYFVDVTGEDQLALEDNIGRTCLHYAVLYRHLDAAKTILSFGVGMRLLETKDASGQTPQEYMYKVENDSLFSKYLNGGSVDMQAYSVKGDLPESTDISWSPNLSDVSSQPYIGSVSAFVGLDYNKMREHVRLLLLDVIPRAIPEINSLNVIGCGSSYEGTKNGLPDEFDFMVKLYSTYEDLDTLDDGYVKMKGHQNEVENLNIIGSIGLWFWDKLMQYWSISHRNQEIVFRDKNYMFKMTLPPQRHPDHKTCTTWVWLCSELTSGGVFPYEVAVSIDLVPAIDIHLQKYVVPKIPHNDGSVSFDDFNQIGRISFPTSEVRHINRLDDKIRNVYITAKCLRSLEVCWFKIKDNEGEEVLVKKYITSYRLKTVFLHLADLFLKTELSLGKMVLMVYEHLERCLERGKLPMFFDPDVNVMTGSKLNLDDSLFVCRLMTKFVRSLYERDCDSATREQDTTRLEELMAREIEDHEVFYEWRAESEQMPGAELPVLPLYLYDIIKETPS